MTSPSATGGTSRCRHLTALAALVLSACSSEHIEPGEPLETGSSSVAPVGRGVATLAGMVSAGAPGLQPVTSAAGSGGSGGSSVTTCSPAAGGTAAAGNKAAAGASAFSPLAGTDAAAAGCGTAAAGHAAGTLAAVSGKAGASSQP